MPQILRPTADISSTGFTPFPAAPATLFDKIDEDVEDLTDYIESTEAPTGDKARFQLAAGVDPNSYGEHDPSVTIRKTVAGGARIDLTVRVFQGSGATPIATHTFTNIGDGWNTYSFGMTTAEIDLITDYSDIELEVEVNQI